MSSGRLPTRPFAPEDDWFVETGGGRSPAADDETVRLWDIDTGHDLMITEPDFVTNALVEIAEHAG